MQIRTTTPADLDAVMAIIEEARRTIAALGINQWQNGTPNRAMLTRDMAEGQGRVVTIGDEIVGTFALIYGGDLTVMLNEMISAGNADAAYLNHAGQWLVAVVGVPNGIAECIVAAMIVPMIKTAVDAVIRRTPARRQKGNTL